MPRFSDIVWLPHPERPDLGLRGELFFENGWSATFLDGDFSIYMRPGIYEIALWAPEGEISAELAQLAAESRHGDAVAMQCILDKIA